MPSITLAPSLDALRAELAHAERELECARMIDNWERRRMETDRWRRRVLGIEKQIERIEEAF